MSTFHFTVLERRGVLAVAGPDAVGFLQGLVTADMRAVSPQRGIYGAMLTPQGKFLHDFFILGLGDSLLIDCDAERAADLLRRLTLHRLRAKVALTDATTSWTVAAVFGEGAAQALGLPPEPGVSVPFGGGVAMIDPRLADIGARVLVPDVGALTAAGLTPAPMEAYERRRIALGLPDGARDIAVERNGVLEAGFDELGGVAWEKGCFMGQEVTARTRYRGLVKKRLVPVAFDGPPPPAETPLTKDGRTVGELRSAVDGIGLAMMRLDALTGEGDYALGEGRAVPRPPVWMKMS